MSKVITFSRFFPAYHPRKGQRTDFIEKIIKSFKIGINEGCESYIDSLTLLGCKPKHHTIRSGHRFKSGEYFSPRLWSGSPYNYKRDGSKCLAFAPDTLVVKTFDFELKGNEFFINGSPFYHQHVSVWHDDIEKLSQNDGLSFSDLLSWFQDSPDFKKSKEFKGQIICWNENTVY